jgi:hypothetical protein
MLYSIFLVCVVGTNNCNKLYAEMPRPLGVSVSDISDDAMLKMCIDNNREDHSFDNPLTNAQGVRVKITPVACVLCDGPPPGTSTANAFVGYH